MSKTVIKIENLSKIYRLGEVGTGTISHDLNRWWKMNILGQDDPYAMIGHVNDRTAKAEKGEMVAALRDINLEVKEGEVLGIIGKNGAGKSTLLKILSRVTSPTTGSIKVSGRMASLLEVGTGFHPDMTGRENIYMNGTIMGMRKWEISKKLDEIVEFAGVAKYLDTPVKRYSSGMTVRLGFAIAAYLEPEILIVDEVLAVGDAEFQKKAIGKMQNVSTNDGRTVLFVSHNMTAVKSLCKKGIILQNGIITNRGDIDSVVSTYLKGDSEINNHKKWNTPIISNSGYELLEVGVKKMGGDYFDIMRVDNELQITIRYRINRDFESLHTTLHYKDEQGNKLFSSFCGNEAIIKYKHLKGEYELKSKIPANFFNWGSFSFDLLIVENKQQCIISESDIISFTLVNREVEIGTWLGREPGEITPKFEWQESKIQ